MGDSARFRLMADVIEWYIDPHLAVADVASGNGQLQAELSRRGFDRITSWDKRRRNTGPRRNYHYGLFDFRNAPRGYDAVIGMHPDAATDHIVCYAVKHRVPFIVCPCCVLPSATRLEDIGYVGWLRHLTAIAITAGFSVEPITLPMSGRNIVLAGVP